MPRYLTLASIILAFWVAFSSSEILTGGLPAAIVIGTAIADYRTWTHRDRPWHDWAVIVLLLPAIAAAVRIAVGGLIVGT